MPFIRIVKEGVYEISESDLKELLKISDKLVRDALSGISFEEFSKRYKELVKFVKSKGRKVKFSELFDKVVDYVMPSEDFTLEDFRSIFLR